MQVRPTHDGRGNGAFAVRHIPAGTCLGDYEGEMLDEAAYWARYPSGVVSSPLTLIFPGPHSSGNILHFCSAKSQGCSMNVAHSV